jgi:hypothetical protein
VMRLQSQFDGAVQINPPWLERSRYIEFLNQIFPGQWNPAAYDWYMARGFNAHGSDILVRAEGTRVLSGATLCYRQIVLGTEAPIEVGVLSAGGTLPAERGCGHYPAILQTAIQRCREKGCVAVLGFVTRNNASGRGLIRIGARAIPSFYLVSSDLARPTRGWQARPLRFMCSGPSRRSGTLMEAFESLARFTVHGSEAAGAPWAHFHYERAEDWRLQFLHRPHAVRVARLAHDSYAAIESVNGTDRLQLLVCPDRKRAGHIASLAVASAAAGRKFFMYTMDPAEVTAARRSHLRIRAGYLMLQPTGVAGVGWDRLAGADWRVQSGDRM